MYIHYQCHTGCFLWNVLRSSYAVYLVQKSCTTISRNRPHFVSFKIRVRFINLFILYFDEQTAILQFKESSCLEVLLTKIHSCIAQHNNPILATITMTTFILLLLWSSLSPVPLLLWQPVHFYIRHCMLVAITGYYFCRSSLLWLISDRYYVLRW